MTYVLSMIIQCKKSICLTLFKVEFSPQYLPPSSLLSSPTSVLHHQHQQHHLHQQMDQSRLELISNTDHDAYFRRHCSLMSFDSIVLIINPRVEKIFQTKLINHWQDKIDKSSSPFLKSSQPVPLLNLIHYFESIVPRSWIEIVFPYLWSFVSQLRTHS